jgi:cell division protein ZipA
MDQLRLILLIVGVLLIAGIFIWELLKKRAAARRRAQLVEHLSEDERGAFAGEFVLGDIGQSDPFEVVDQIQGRRSGDRGPHVDEMGDEAGDEGEAVVLTGYDIDEDFPGEATEDVTETPAGAGMAAAESLPTSGGDMPPLSGFAARRDSPEQLDLAGLELAAPARGGDVLVEGHSTKGEAKRGAKREERGARIERTVKADNEEELHIVMTVMARSGERFAGEAVRHALEHVDLYHGDMNIFHRHEKPEDPATPTLFSAANVLAPGHFEPARMDSQTSPGIAMFMRLPGPQQPADAFQQMLDAARTVAEDLNGTLCDETRSTLTPQSINHLRERIADFRRRQMLKA